MCIIAAMFIIPLVIYNHYNDERKANAQAIANDRTEIRNLQRKRKKKIEKIYKRKENIKELNQRLHDDTDILLESQRVLLQEQSHKVDADKATKAETDMSKVTAQNLSLSNGLLFNYGKMPLTIAASYPSKFKVGQDQIPIIVHAYNSKNQEIAFAVVYYDPNEHVFARVDNYSVTRQKKQSKGQGSDYQSYLKEKREKAKREAAEKARKKAEQARKEELAKEKAAKKAKSHHKSNKKKAK